MPLHTFSRLNSTSVVNTDPESHADVVLFNFLQKSEMNDKNEHMAVNNSYDKYIIYQYHSELHCQYQIRKMKYQNYLELQ